MGSQALKSDAPGSIPSDLYDPRLNLSLPLFPYLYMEDNIVSYPLRLF